MAISLIASCSFFRSRNENRLESLNDSIADEPNSPMLAWMYTDRARLHAAYCFDRSGRRKTDGCDDHLSQAISDYDKSVQVPSDFRWVVEAHLARGQFLLNHQNDVQGAHAEGLLVVRSLTTDLPKDLKAEDFLTLRQLGWELLTGVYGKLERTAGSAPEKDRYAAMAIQARQFAAADQAVVARNADFAEQDRQAALKKSKDLAEKVRKNQRGGSCSYCKGSGKTTGYNAGAGTNCSTTYEKGILTNTCYSGRDSSWSSEVCPVCLGTGIEKDHEEHGE